MDQDKQLMIIRIMDDGLAEEAAGACALAGALLSMSPRVFPTPRGTVLIMGTAYPGKCRVDSREFSVSLHTPEGGAGKIAEMGWPKNCSVTTEQVAGFFRRRSHGSRSADLGEDNSPSMAPGAYDHSKSFAVWPIGGDLPPKYPWVTKDHRYSDGDYMWYDLDKVAVGGAVWRISCTYSLWFFHRETAETWRAYCVPGFCEPFGSPRMGGREIWELVIPE